MPSGKGRVRGHLAQWKPGGAQWRVVAKYRVESGGQEVQWRPVVPSGAVEAGRCANLHKANLHKASRELCQSPRGQPCEYPDTRSHPAHTATRPPPPPSPLLPPPPTRPGAACERVAKCIAATDDGPVGGWLGNEGGDAQLQPVVGHACITSDAVATERVCTIRTERRGTGRWPNHFSVPLLR